MINPQFASIGQQFAEHYYKTFDSSRGSLGNLYGPNSMLTFENEQFQGGEAIVKKLASLPFSTVRHETTTVDCQPNPSNGGVLVMVTGNLFVDGSATPIKFAQTFHLVPAQTGFFCLNDMFRLNYG